MNWKFFALAAVYWVAVAIVLVLLFNFDPQLATSRWTFAGLVAISLVAVFVVKKLSAPET
jgi:hypothetical protein